MTTNEDRAREWEEDHSEEEVNPFNIASLARLLTEAEDRGRTSALADAVDVALRTATIAADEEAERYAAATADASRLAQLEAVAEAARQYMRSEDPDDHDALADELHRLDALGAGKGAKK